MAPASVYIGGLPESVTRLELNDHLSIYGKVTALNIHKGYSFVEFEVEADALDFVAAYAKQPFLGTACKIEVAKQPRRQPKAGTPARMPETTSNCPRLSSPENSRVRYPVVVHNLNPQTCWQELKDFGRRTGSTVAFCDIDRTDRRRGFLEYYTQDAADRVVRELNNQELKGHRVTLNGYGKKTLREEVTQVSCSSRSPMGREDAHVSRPSRSPPTTRSNRFHRSRSPSEPYYHPSTLKRGPHYSPRRYDTRSASPRRLKPGYETIYPPRHEDRRTRFTTEDSAYGGMTSRSRSPTRGRRATDYYDDLSYMSDERRLQIDKLADEWMSYSRLTPPRI